MSGNPETLKNVKPLKIFQVNELVERILKNLDNDSLLMARLVSKLWNQEVERILLHRRYRKPKHVDANSSDIKQLFDLLENAQIKPSILFPVISIDLNKSFHQMFKTFLTTYGIQLTSLEIFSHHINITIPSRKIKLMDILKNCPNLQTLKLTFHDFHHCDNSQSNHVNIPSETLKCPLLLYKLTSFEFEIIIRRNLIPCLCNAMILYLSLFKKIIQSANYLIILGINTLRVADLPDFLKVMTIDPLVARRLKQLKILRLYNQGPFPEPDRIFNSDLVNFLPVVSSSLEVLSLVGVTYIDVNLSAYPIMPKLTTLIIKAKYYLHLNVNLSMNLTFTSLPQLQTMILGECGFGFNSGYLDVKWPFCRTLNGTELNKLNWEHEMKCFTFNNSEVASDMRLKPATKLTAVVYVSWGGMSNLPWLNKTLEELSRINVTSLFINLMGRVGHKELREHCISKCSNDIRCLKQFIIRTIYDPYPLVFYL